MTSETSLDRRALNRALLARQLLLEREARSVADVLEHLVGMQAQLPNNPYVALWSRLRDFSPDELSSMIEERRAVRIALMRSTIHLVTADDCLALRPVVQSAIDRMFSPGSTWITALDGVDVDELLAVGRRIIDEQPRGHTELGKLLAQRWPTHDAHALAMAIRAGVPLVQVPPRGVWGKAGRPLVTSAEAWLGRPLGAEARVDDVILRYLGAFGPAGAADFRRWSGLTGRADAFKRLRPELVTFRDANGKELFDLPNAPRPEADVPAPVRFLPEYDNVSLSHADRSRIISREDVERGTIGKPFFLVDGFVAGTWAVQRSTGHATLTVSPFVKLKKVDKAAVMDEAASLVAFLAPDLEHEFRLESAMT